MTKIKIVFSTWMSIIICAFLVLSSHDSAQAIQPDTFNYPPINDPEQTAREEDQATSPLSLKLTGGAGLKTVTISGKTYTYYPIKAGETRVLVATWTGGAVSESPVWAREGGGYSPFQFISRSNGNPTTLTGNCLTAIMETSRPGWVRVSYGGYSKTIWIWPQGHWSPIARTAVLNGSSARLKAYGAANQWTYADMNDFRYMYPKSTNGELAMKSAIVPAGSYPGAPAPTWVANQSRLKFNGSATGWTVNFTIKKQGETYLTAIIGDYAVTVIVAG